MERALITKADIIADYHTHTVYSHGKGTVEDNIKTAEAIGLDTIAITDHGVDHFIYGVSKKSLKKQSEEILRLREHYPNIRVLRGVESDLKGMSGKIDLSKEQIDNLDIILCGFHKPVWGDKFSDYLKLFYNSYSHFMYKPTKTQIDRNTKAYINAVINNPIDILTHINYHLKVDCKEIAKVCSDYGTVIEISSRHNDCNSEDYEDLFSSNALFAVNSDAHRLENIGNCDKALEVINEFGVDAKKIINVKGTVWDKRSKR